jgi:hypothetical protein
MFYEGQTLDFQSTALPTELPSLCKRPWPAASMSGLLIPAFVYLGRGRLQRSTSNPQLRMLSRASVEFKTCAAIPLLYAEGAGNAPAKFRYRQIVAGAG